MEFKAKLAYGFVAVFLGLITGVIAGGSRTDQPQVLGITDTGQMVQLNQGQAAKARCADGSDRIRTSRVTLFGKEIVTFACVTPRPPRPTKIVAQTSCGNYDCSAQCAAAVAACASQNPLAALAVPAQTTATPPITPSATPTTRPGATAAPTQTPTPPPPTPTTVLASCHQACTSDDQCVTGNCQGLVNTFTGTTISSKSTRLATTADYAWMKADQNIYISAVSWRSMDAANGKGVYGIVSRKSGTLNVYLYRITAADPLLDPRVLLLQKSLVIAAGQVVNVEVSVPSCGRYAVNFGSPMVLGTKYYVNPASPDYFWGDGDFRFACIGCCR